ncbi:hypothetical protein [Paenibacillus ginsengarvi]|uniref:Exo-alpha-sialidase n=1 Tax=Paenibacillus ginsengarvi TaxID=400777 RepID=A0A3B0BU25_9BACL|nr:hypothetical protein [Paenibacillus ginsengarvi]RKN75878.1 hypothetical protein D7M11_25580 [Paenibacillus ginsengarvi]
MNALPKRIRVLTDNGSGGPARYYAFPTVLPLPDGTLLVAYKNGDRHALDPEASLETLRYEPNSGEVVSRQTIDRTPGWIHQNPELTRMPDGTITLSVDIQRPGGVKMRMGLRVYRSDDESESFRDEGWFPQAGGYAYGYALDDAHWIGTEDKADLVTEQIEPAKVAVDLLAMSFPELAGGRRAVHALRSADSGHSWSHIRNLNEEFDFAFNECALLAYRDGYVIVARGDNQATRAYRTDREFRRTGESRWSDVYDSIAYIGRPKLFERAGNWYVLCRNVARGAPTSLRLYRFDPETLTLLGNVLLDENESQIGHSYYAEHLFTGEGEETRLHVITYAPHLVRDMPDIIAFTFDWAQIRESIG